MVCKTFIDAKTDDARYNRMGKCPDCETGRVYFINGIFIKKIEGDC